MIFLRSRYARSVAVDPEEGRRIIDRRPTSYSTRRPTGKVVVIQHCAWWLADEFQKYYLRRVLTCFDDTTGTGIELYKDYTGQRLAIDVFDQTHDKINFGRPYNLPERKFAETWYHRIWLCHFFNRSRYNDFVSIENQQLNCR